MTSGDRETTVAELEYEPTNSAQPVMVEHDGGVIRIIVAMAGSYAPVPKWTTQLDIISLFVMPAALIVAIVSRLVIRKPNPPRAVFEIDAGNVRILMRDRSTGDVTRMNFPRTALVEARPNRFEKGLWLNVTGNIKSTFLQDVPTKVLATLAEEIQAALSPPAPTGT